jgi:hypothetical protein
MKFEMVYLLFVVSAAENEKACRSLDRPWILLSLTEESFSSEGLFFREFIFSDCSTHGYGLKASKDE